jgi:hypothetical protein
MRSVLGELGAATSEEEFTEGVKRRGSVRLGGAFGPSGFLRYGGGEPYVSVDTIGMTKEERSRIRGLARTMNAWLSDNVGSVQAQRLEANQGGADLCTLSSATGEYRSGVWVEAGSRSRRASIDAVVARDRRLGGSARRVLSLFAFPLALALLPSCWSGPMSAGDTTETWRYDGTDGECIDPDFNEPCDGDCECFVGEYGSVCEAKCCDPVVEMKIDTGESWTFETGYQCMILCAGPQFTCPSGMVCNTVGPICVWPD